MVGGLAKNGILFTNKFAVQSDMYAQRRALTNNSNDIDVWLDHLSMHGIHSVSSGLMFIRTVGGKSFQNESSHDRLLALVHHFVPKTDQGSIWTPHNFAAVNFTRNLLMGYPS